ncbi:hypothetical protein TGAM01_v211051 [Trichoderma gamsii]|uniref:Uncharacterized protein n=1 Tax=Trichoderma gamsii TaxID=398673 RepID=A0A2P4Z717_9HYPO|nr:hypothetical protein TGAM01_v211051 [Trichoderma gamsii]PON20070.1 hypothetical protein TGAM01_v211051 [Trichoderma gamsii]
MEETIDLDWYLNSQNLNYGTPVPPTPGSSSATQHAEENAGPRRHATLPLLRRSNWEKERLYDINNPVCIHYDIQWKVSQYNGQKKRASEEECLRGKIDEFVNEKLGENDYIREEANVTISIKNSREHGFKEEYHDKPIDWDEVNDHLAGLGHLFEKGRKISIDIDLAYREIVRDTASTDNRGKKRTVSERRREEMEAEAGIYRSVYKKLRCDGEDCKSGPHCAVDAQGNHFELIPYYIEKIVDFVRNGGYFGGPRDLPAEIWQALYKDAAAKKKTPTNKCGRCSGNMQAPQAGSSSQAEATPQAPSPIFFQGKWDELLQQYDAYLVEQVDCSDWKKALSNASKVARKLFLELSFSHAHQKFASNKLIASGVPPSIAGQWTGNIKAFYEKVMADST